MEKNSTKLFLEVDASQIDVKQLLKKDFLELSMKAISSANPNRNNSWFTKESMEKSIGSFINKPILGYFENDDFVSHNGDWNYDSETEMDYWDTLGKKGERILGIIRESDEVKIIEDQNGLSWVTFTCALWTQYSFKQVKRLIKDAKRAQKTGESTKNISVEVDITDYEILDNGVMKINEFNLVGVTILGTRNGVKVEPGIEDAELSVVDIMGRDVYSAQEKTLRLAYEKLNDSVINKEESQVEKKEIQQDEALDETLSAEDPKVDESAQPINENCDCAQKEEDQGEVCPDCGKNPCVCEDKQAHEEGCGADEHLEDGGESAEDHDGSENAPENKANESEGEGCIGCDAHQEGDGSCADGCGDGGTPAVDEHCESDANKELYEAKVKEYDELLLKYNALVEEKDGLIKDLTEARSVIHDYEHHEFLSKAYALIKSAKLDEEMSAQFTQACEKSEINTIEDLKVKVAVAAFDAKSSDEDGVTSFTAPVSNPDTTAVFDENKNVKAKKGDHWAALRDYVGK